MDGQSKLKSEAEAIIEDLGLLELLAPFGEARVVGSVALNLIVKLDIDIHLLIRDGSTEDVADRVYCELAAHDRVTKAHVHDYRSQGGLKVGIDAYPGESGDWSIDIWVTDKPETVGFNLVDRLSRNLTADDRKAILSIKRHYVDRGIYKAGLGSLICEAVADRGIRTVEDFESFLRHG